jgi:rSAM/selenodomain-associated transferase 2
MGSFTVLMVAPDTPASAESRERRTDRFPVISVIIPTRGEGPEAAARFLRFGRGPDRELLVADGGSPASTLDAFRGAGARVLELAGTRGARLARAVSEAHGDVFFFLHADSRPPGDALAIIRRTISAGATAGAFSLAYEGAGPAMDWIAWWANRRSRLARLPFGDQGIFCRRDAYERAGGFRDLPVCDDLDFVLRLKRAGRFVVRPEKTHTSPRRYLEHGAARQVLRNWAVILGYFAGVSPAALSRWYETSLRAKPNN